MGEKYKTKELNKVKKCEDTVSIKRLHEDITKSKKKKIVSYRQNLIFKSFIEKHNFITITKHFGVTISFLILTKTLTANSQN